MKKIITVVFCLFLSIYTCAQTQTYGTVKLTSALDQLRFEVPGQPRYFFFSKTVDSSDRAFALYSPEDGGYFTYWKENSGDMIINKGNVGVGIREPAAKIDVNGGMRIRGRNSVASVNGFQNSLELLTPGSAALVYQPGTSEELMFGFHRNGNFYWGTGKTADNKYSMILNRDGHLEVKGSLGIGVSTSATSAHKLTVEGSIGAREVNVKTGAWADFVFDPAYQLMDLKDLETYILQYQHLPLIPTEKEVLQNGQNIGEINQKLLQKIEELTLYIIQQDKQIDALAQSNRLLTELAEKVAQLEKKQ